MTAALRATGLLRDFCELGVLVAADVHVASRLGALTGEADERVLLAVALTVRGTRLGSVVLDLADVPATVTPDVDAIELPALVWPPLAEWVSACAASPLVAPTDGGCPVRMVGSRLWLDRYWRQEAFIADDLLRRSADRPSDLSADQLAADLDSLFDEADADQRAATSTAATSRISVLAGGPGTGKTTTIARLIAVLLRQLPALRVALAAPTGKAAARLEEAVRSAGAPLTASDQAALQRLSAATLHRLLGRRPGSASRFRHDRENRLPYDVVIVDESSMVSLTLMARLLEALPPSCRLVLVGDPDQLASVEAGAVLGDLVEAAGALDGSVQTLRRIRRFEADGSIAELARLVRAGDADGALDLLSASPTGLIFHRTPDDVPLAGPALDALHSSASYELDVIMAARSGSVAAALDALDRHRLLCAHRSGPRGVRHWSDAIERWLTAADPTVSPRLDGYYAGQPLLVTVNDYENGLYNGDTGVVVQHGDELAAAFRRGGAPVVLPLVRLSDVRPLHAMTVHRAQGSQFASVTVLLPLADSPLATRQTFYTAVTRAASSVTVIGSEDAVLACVRRRAARASGLSDRITGALA